MYRALTLSVCVLFAPILFADQFQMKNGDRLTAQIQRFDGKTITAKSDYAGDMTIAMDAVERITSDQILFVTLSNGKTTQGRIDASANEITIRDENASAKSTMTEVVAIRNQAVYAQEVARYENPGWLSLWTGYVESGLSLTQGNSETTNFATGAHATRTTLKDKTSLYLATVYAKDSTTGKSRTTANAIRWGGRYEYNLTSRLSAFGFTDFEHDQFQLLDVRFVPGGGIGWYLIKGTQSEFQIFGGGSYNYENFSDGITRNSAELLTGEDWIYKLSDRVSFTERFTYFPNLNETGEYRLTFDSGILTKLNGWLDWHLTLSDRYLSNPVATVKKNDFLLTTGVRLSLGE
jgi:putative salt-induced outer membrane protein